MVKIFLITQPTIEIVDRPEALPPEVLKNYEDPSILDSVGKAIEHSAVALISDIHQTRPRQNSYFEIQGETHAKNTVKVECLEDGVAISVVSGGHGHELLHGFFWASEQVEMPLEIQDIFKNVSLARVMGTITTRKRFLAIKNKKSAPHRDLFNKGTPQKQMAALKMLAPQLKSERDSLGPFHIVDDNGEPLEAAKVFLVKNEQNTAYIRATGFSGASGVSIFDFTKILNQQDLKLVDDQFFLPTATSLEAYQKKKEMIPVEPAALEALILEKRSSGQTLNFSTDKGRQIIINPDQIFVYNDGQLVRSYEDSHTLLKDLDDTQTQVFTDRKDLYVFVPPYKRKSARLPREKKIKPRQTVPQGLDRKTGIEILNTIEGAPGTYTYYGNCRQTGSHYSGKTLRVASVFDAETEETTLIVQLSSGGNHPRIETLDLETAKQKLQTTSFEKTDASRAARRFGIDLSKKSKIKPKRRPPTKDKDPWMEALKKQVYALPLGKIERFDVPFIAPSRDQERAALEKVKNEAVLANRITLLLNQLLFQPIARTATQRSALLIDHDKSHGSLLYTFDIKPEDLTIEEGPVLTVTLKKWYQWSIVLDVDPTAFQTFQRIVQEASADPNAVAEIAPKDPRAGKNAKEEVQTEYPEEPEPNEPVGFTVGGLDELEDLL